MEVTVEVGLSVQPSHVYTVDAYTLDGQSLEFPFIQARTKRQRTYWVRPLATATTDRIGTMNPVRFFIFRSITTDGMNDDGLIKVVGYFSVSHKSLPLYESRLKEE